jgi:hypothetical protein
MSSLPAAAVTAPEEAREWAQHTGALASLEEQGWRFGRSDEGVFVAERTSGRGVRTRRREVHP